MHEFAFLHVFSNRPVVTEGRCGASALRERKQRAVARLRWVLVRDAAVSWITAVEPCGLGQRQERWAADG